MIRKDASSLPEDRGPVATEFVAHMVDCRDDESIQGLQLGPGLGRGHGVGPWVWQRLQRHDQLIIVKIEVGITSHLRF